MYICLSKHDGLSSAGGQAPAQLLATAALRDRGGKNVYRDYDRQD